MERPFFLLVLTLSIMTLIMELAVGTGHAENIDPDDNDSQYAYGENVGWLNAEPSGDGGDGVQVDGFKLTGYIWAENIGWISLSCQNTASCTTVDYGVVNDGLGYLSGYAWGENVGWINFAPNRGNVRINSQGRFTGYAWGENVGWINFNSHKLVSSWLGVGSGAMPWIFLLLLDD